MDLHSQDESKIEEEVQEWLYYFKPLVVSNLINKKYVLFGIIVGSYYCICFVCCVSACNIFSDVSRKTACSLHDGE